ncbi:hypothetical protein Pelo_3379 [Pelomyxa schiedti]|nr:hypothetical protein Pelo_4923 [Pelomyxa schiedti]KAH3764754.1 hypothetical protein Pelo_3379 [Pelomyxa schiedti]
MAKYNVADTPGLKSGAERVDHAMHILSCLEYRPVKCLIAVCSMKDRIDGVIDSVSELIVPFWSDFAQHLALIITKQDLQPHISKVEVQQRMIELGIPNVLVTHKATPRQELLLFLDQLKARIPGSVSFRVAPTQLYRYFNLAEADFGYMADMKTFVDFFKDLVATGEKHLLTLQGNARRDFAFSFKAFMSDLMPQFQSEFAGKHDVNAPKTLLYAMELQKRCHRELLAVRRLCREYGLENDNSTYKSCPYCGTVYVKVQGCDGTTTCGNRPSVADGHSFSIFEWTFETARATIFSWSNPRNTRAVECSSAVNTSQQVAWKDMTPVQQPADWAVIGEVADTRALETPLDAQTERMFKSGTVAIPRTLPAEELAEHVVSMLHRVDLASVPPTTFIADNCSGMQGEVGGTIELETLNTLWRNSQLPRNIPDNSHLDDDASLEPGNSTLDEVEYGPDAEDPFWPPDEPPIILSRTQPVCESAGIGAHWYPLTDAAQENGVQLCSEFSLSVSPLYALTSTPILISPRHSNLRITT